MTRMLTPISSLKPSSSSSCFFSFGSSSRRRLALCTGPPFESDDNDSDHLQKTLLVYCTGLFSLQKAEPSDKSELLASFCTSGPPCKHFDDLDHLHKTLLLYHQKADPFEGSHLGWHDGTLIGHHNYITEQSHGSFTWLIKSVTYRYVTINYVKSSFMTLYLHKKHLQDGSLV